MNYIYIGDIVGTHGIKGEVKVLSDFDYIKKAFKVGNKVYAGSRKEELIIKSHRKHKNYELLTFNDYSNINDVIPLKNDELYIDRKDLKINTYLKQDLIGMEVYGDNKLIGEVETLMKSKKYDILVIMNGNKKYLVPNIKEYINKVDLDNKKIEINVIEGLLDEN